MMSIPDKYLDYYCVAYSYCTLDKISRGNNIILLHLLHSMLAFLLAMGHMQK